MCETCFQVQNVDPIVGKHIMKHDMLLDMTTHHVPQMGGHSTRCRSEALLEMDKQLSLKYSTTHLSPTLSAIDVNMLLDLGRLKAALLSDMIEGDALLFRS